MVFTVKQMKNEIKHYDHGIKKLVVYNAYAFSDVNEHTIIIVAGEKRRNDVIKYLSENEKI